MPAVRVRMCFLALAVAIAVVVVVIIVCKWSLSGRENTKKTHSSRTIVSCCMPSSSFVSFYFSVLSPFPLGFSLSHFQSHTHGHIAMQNCELYLFAEMPVAYTKKEVIFAFFFVAPLCQHILTIGVVVTVFRRRFGMVVTLEIPANISHVREPKPLNIWYKSIGIRSVRAYCSELLSVQLNLSNWMAQLVCI